MEEICIGDVRHGEAAIPRQCSTREDPVLPCSETTRRTKSGADCSRPVDEVRLSHFGPRSDPVLSGDSESVSASKSAVSTSQLTTLVFLGWSTLCCVAIF